MAIRTTGREKFALLFESVLRAMKSSVLKNIGLYGKDND
jgi:hypothetical protein